VFLIIPFGVGFFNSAICSSKLFLVFLGSLKLDEGLERAEESFFVDGVREELVCNCEGDGFFLLPGLYADIFAMISSEID